MGSGLIRKNSVSSFLSFVHMPITRRFLCITERKNMEPSSIPSRQPPVEVIKHGEVTIAVIIKSGYMPDKTEFLTPHTFTQQVGFISYPKGGETVPHVHKQMERIITDTSECLLVRKGRVELSLFSAEMEAVASRELLAGDVVLLVVGGHGLRYCEDTVLLEIKQGPYLGPDDKELL